MRVRWLGRGTAVAPANDGAFMRRREESAMSKHHSFTQLLAAGFCFAAANGCMPTSEGDEVEIQESELFGGSPHLRVMTQNMYVGTNVDPILAAAPEELPWVVAEAFATLQSTDLEGRVAAMAAEIQNRRPHLIGLQEVSLIRVQDPGDLVFGGHVPAETVAYDFLPALLDALASQGLGYHVAASIQNTDGEAPMITPSFSFVDVRLTDFDVILARDDVATTVVAERNFAVSLPLPNGLVVKRGYVAVDAIVDGRTYRFVSTHLEDGLLEAQLAQTQELISFLASTRRQLILAGDFNSRSPDGDSYRMLLASGYRDTWLETRHHDAGFTCCQAADLRNEASALSSRIDFIFMRNLPRARGRARTTGDDRTESGLWPSDHAGVTATFR
jgi:hypothetical protein